MSLSSQIMTGLVLGVAAGLFFGEPMGALASVGDAFIKLLQMTVLPYVVTSLIAGLGRLQGGVARMLAVRGGLLLAFLWALAFAMVALTPLTFPALKSASFFSTTLVSDRPPLDIVGLYIPANPFFSLANNQIPGVVLFSIAVGVALMGMADKQKLIDPLETISNALHRISTFVVRLMPIGVFAIGASAAGTMEIEEAQRIQIYVASYVLGCLAMSFLVLPGLVAALTPIPFREAAGLGRGVLLTAFATGSEFIVLPLIGDRCKELIRRYAPDRPHAEEMVDVVVPVAFSFPHVAKLLSLNFVPFAAWFSGTSLDIWDYPRLWFGGIVSLFGSINLAMPFLLNLLEVPEDLFQLFLATGVINARFGTLLAAVHIVSLTLLASCAIGGGFRPRWGRALISVGASLCVVAVVFMGCRIAYVTWFDTGYYKGQVLQKMQISHDDVRTTVYQERAETPPLTKGVRRIDEIRDRGELRICYWETGFLPFSFVNAAGELVGLDIELVHSLARELHLDLAFVPVVSEFGSQPEYAKALRTGYCDLSITGTVISMSDIYELDYSRPYLTLNLGFLTRDHRRREFSSLGAIAQRDDLRLAIPADSYWVERLSRMMPGVEFVPVKSVSQYLAAGEEALDGMVFLAEAGSAWTLLHPEYSVVVPDPPIQEVPMAYLLPEGEPDWVNTVDSWIELKKLDGTIDAVYDNWILGRAAERDEPRWSIIRDVLHWVE